MINEDIKKFLSGNIKYDSHGQQIYADDRLILNLRGWSAVEKKFLVNGRWTEGAHEKATAFQDAVGEFIAKAIAEKLSKSASSHKVPAVSFIGTMMANVDNDKLSDADFRQMFRNTLPIVEKPTYGSIVNAGVAESVARYYSKEETR